jgi:hypothetical protein
VITIKKTFVFLIVASLAMVCNAHALPLTGQTLAGSGTGLVVVSPPQAVVGVGIEFSASHIAFPDIPIFDIDFTESGQVIVGAALGGLFGLDEDLGFVFSDTLVAIDDIVGLSLIGSVGVFGIEQSDLTFGTDFISLSVGGTDWSAGGHFTAQMDFATPVPEPTTMLLLGSGLIGLIGYRRKLKK